MHHSLVSMACRGRDVGARNIARRKCHTLTSAVSLESRVPARFLIPHLSVKSWIYLPGFSRAFGRVLNTKKGPAVQSIYRGFASRQIPGSPLFPVTGPLTGGPCAGSYHLCRLKNPTVVYMITCRLSFCKTGMFNVHLLIIHEKGCSRMDRKKQVG